MSRGLGREILALAVPALGALVAEPLFVTVDSAFVAHVSTAALGGLGLASSIVMTVVGLAIFLAYSTTADVARLVGKNDMPSAIAKGLDASWLAIVIGVICGLSLVALGTPILRLFDPSANVLAEALTYLRISSAGLPAMLLIQAAMGLVRGLQNTRITLIIALAGSLANIPINAALIFGAGLGIAGSAIGTIVCQWGMAAAYLVIIVHHAHANGQDLHPRLVGVKGTWSHAKWLCVRTAAMRVVLLVTTGLASSFGTVALGVHQLMNVIYNVAAMALDSLAIAAQALTGKYLGAGEAGTVRQLTRRLVTWSVVGGAVVAVVLFVASFVLPGLFTPDERVRELLRPALLIFVVAQPLAGYVFCLDGIFMGAGDAKYLAKASTLTTCVYLPFAAVLWYANPGTWGVVWLWGIFAFVFLGTRAATLAWRMRSDAWMGA